MQVTRETSKMDDFRGVEAGAEKLKFATLHDGLQPRSKDATRNKCIASSNRCLTSSNKKLLGAPGPTTRNKKLLGAKGIATRSKDATRGSWPYY